MYSISSQVVNNYSSNDSLNKLLKDIDSKILSFAYYEYNCIRLGQESELDISAYEDLCIYKEILLTKLLGCNCLDDAWLIKIVSKIKKLLR